MASVVLPSSAAGVTATGKGELLACTREPLMNAPTLSRYAPALVCIQLMPHVPSTFRLSATVAGCPSSPPSSSRKTLGRNLCPTDNSRDACYRTAHTLPNAGTGAHVDDTRYHQEHLGASHVLERQLDLDSVRARASRSEHHHVLLTRACILGPREGGSSVRPPTLSGRRSAEQTVDENTKPVAGSGPPESTVHLRV
eukprot:897954-Rhodomonas_salina.5